MSLLEKFAAVKVFAFDIDGVLTDGTVYLMESGEQVRRMNIKDGFALQLAIKKGYQVLIISGSYSEPAEKRLRNLGITEIHMRVHDKLECVRTFLAKQQLSMHEVLFMGDDVPDWQLMQEVSISACPKDAVADIRGTAQYISLYGGGAGCVRDVIEKVLKINGHWELETKIPSR